jgi:hypothetical protein
MKKIKDMNQLGYNIYYIWKYHKETTCVATFISNKQKILFFSFFFKKFREQEVRTGLPRGVGWY